MLCLSLLRLNLFRSAFIICFISFAQSSHCQQGKSYSAAQYYDDAPRTDQALRLISYNVENLFDYFDDPFTLDDEFLPNEGRFWTKARYSKKQHQLAQVIMAIGGWEAPGIIGLCEIENRYVLETLTKFTALKTAQYGIIHKDSPDSRGIDVALLYRRDKFELSDFDFIPISFPFDKESTTRDILYAQGLMQNGDTLHLFVNHWPSKYGGEFETAAKRFYAAEVLKQKMDSLRFLKPQSLIIAMGDFNDEPSAAALKHIQQDPAYDNLMDGISSNLGTHSFENRWSLLDQFIISSSLKDQKSSSRVLPNSVKIFDLPFVLKEGALGNMRPFRTYQGPAYLGGFSDHLPIFLDISFR
jgi:predicted extracellular nuclease